MAEDSCPAHTGFNFLLLQGHCPKAPTKAAHEDAEAPWEHCHCHGKHLWCRLKCASLLKLDCYFIFLPTDNRSGSGKGLPTGMHCGGVEQLGLSGVSQGKASSTLLLACSVQQPWILEAGGPAALWSHALVSA